MTLRRTQVPSPDLWKAACQKDKRLVTAKVKNVKTNSMGTKLGRIHMCVECASFYPPPWCQSLDLLTLFTTAMVFLLMCFPFMGFILFIFNPVYLLRTPMFYPNTFYPDSQGRIHMKPQNLDKMDVRRTSVLRSSGKRDRAEGAGAERGERKQRKLTIRE
eukprot:CAMPEP_0173283036 /NCGR_PEP_ID=MMETSP1143-20121109/7164_1 /TAXON_ID=483371 /ORGANISM="non described non described, Strain CCMP2298" /LENGTH=159 /DNA_ID=CAMNT_0014220697 /DNA_START=45 /DNA_END=524 /DNA_ORIENTATION=-